MGTTFAEKKEEAANAAVEMRKRITESVTSGEDWQRYLNIMGKLHTYSPNNALYMAYQWMERQIGQEAVRAVETMFYGAPTSAALPDISTCAGFSAWGDLGGQVRKGEKALAVYAPFLVNDKENVDPNTGKPRKKLIGFTLKRRTFDISQVDGVEIPEPCKLLQGEGPEGAWDRLTALAEALGFPVEEEPMAGTKANGFCSYLPQRIVVKSSNPMAQKVKTLVHEIGHAMLHGMGDGVPSNVREIEAESVAYVVCQALDFDTADYSLGYVGGWSGGDGDLIASVLERVASASARVLTWIESGELVDAKGAKKFFEPNPEDVSVIA